MKVASCGANISLFLSMYFSWRLYILLWAACRSERKFYFLKTGFSSLAFEQEWLNILKLILGTTSSHNGVLLHVWKRKISIKEVTLLKLNAGKSQSQMWSWLSWYNQWDSLISTAMNPNLLQWTNINTKNLNFRKKDPSSHGFVSSR